MYLIRRPNPYRPKEWWYFRDLYPFQWTNDVIKAQFYTREKAEEIAMQFLEKNWIACEILGPYQ